MNKLLIAFIILNANTICYGQDSKRNNAGYRIEGHILGLQEGSRIYLINGGQRKRIDSSVVKNNHFILMGKLNEPAHMYLYSGKSTKLADILLDNSDIEIMGNKPLYDSIKIKGSDIDKQWKEWFQDDQRIGYLKYRLDQLHKSLIKKGDSENSAIVKNLVEELMIDRINLMKGYVRRYNDAASGAVLPTLCPIQESLTKSDYLEMYNSLTPRIRLTTLGREILNLAEKSKS